MDWNNAENMQPLKAGRKFSEEAPSSESTLPKAALADADARRT